MSEHTPTPWRMDPTLHDIYADNVPKGPMKVADIRGWGYLTGKGHGALGLSYDEGVAVQAANAAFIVKAVNLHDALVKALDDLQSAETAYRMTYDLDGYYHQNTLEARGKLRTAGYRAREVLASVGSALNPVDK